MDRYEIGKIGQQTVILSGGKPVLTPSGRMLGTTNEDVAGLVYQDVQEYGPHPRDSLSYVMLHMSYLDFGHDISRSDLIQGITNGYNADWDVALASLSAFDSLWKSSPSSGGEIERGGVAIDPSMWFGPPEHSPTVLAWLESLTVRAICSMQCCGAACRSIHVGFRLLHDEDSFSASHLAKGLIACSEDMHPFFGESGGDSVVEEAKVVEFLEKVRTYASFPDEPDQQ